MTAILRYGDCAGLWFAKISSCLVTRQAGLKRILARNKNKSTLRESPHMLFCRWTIETICWNPDGRAVVIRMSGANVKEERWSHERGTRLGQATPRPTNDQFIKIFHDIISNRTSQHKDSACWSNEAWSSFRLILSSKPITIWSIPLTKFWQELSQSHFPKLHRLI